MSKYLLILEYAGEELDVAGYYRVEFDTSLPDPDFFGILNSSTRPWAVDSMAVLDENLERVFDASVLQTVLEPKHAIEIPYSVVKEKLIERESTDTDRNSAKTS